jgi:5-methylcytosine-specific restriction enzyme subunit McrC
MPPVIRLTERVPRLVRLRRTDADFLLANHRGRFEVMPIAWPREYRLTALGVVGILQLPHATLSIRPKLSAANMALLIDMAEPPPDWSSHSAVDADRLIGLLACWFARLFAERADSGLPRDYVERRERSQHLRGRLDVGRQLAAGPGLKDRLHCRFEEFTIDTSANRLSRAVAQALLSRSDVSEPIKSAIRAALGAFDEVSTEPISPELCAAAQPRSGAAADDQRLVDVSRLVASGLGFDVGRSAGPSFLLDLEEIWERYVTASIARAFADRSEVSVHAQPILSIGRDSDQQPPLRLRPDVVIRLDGKPRFVVDAKWKRLDASPPTDDVHQALAYAAALGASKAALVYPGGGSRRRAYTTAGPRLNVLSLRVTGPAAQCETARRRFGRWIAGET